MTDDASWVAEFASLPGGVVVLCGGPGGEREVSLDSGDNVHRALTRAGVPNRHVVVPVENPDDFLAKLECSLAVVMLHGEFGEDGGAQTILERRGIPYTGSGPDACRLSMDKNAVKLILRDLGVPTPRWVVAETREGAERLVGNSGLRYPFFVKPNGSGSSVGVSRVDDPVELDMAVEEALSPAGSVLIEEMVVGRELTVGWLGGVTLPCIELDADGVFYDYRAKYQSDETRYRCPADLDPVVAEQISCLSAKVAEAVGARDLARVDIMLGADGPMVLELNALPGFTTHSLLPMAAAAAGIPIERLCLSLAAMAAKRGGGDR